MQPIRELRGTSPSLGYRRSLHSLQVVLCAPSVARRAPRAARRPLTILASLATRLRRTGDSQFNGLSGETALPAGCAGSQDRSRSISALGMTTRFPILI